MVNAAGRLSGGARTYLLALLRELERGGVRGLRWEVLVSEDVTAEIDWAAPAGVAVRRVRPLHPALRIVADQVVVPLRARRGTVLLSARNFAALVTLRPQVLVAHNALYFSDAILHEIGDRRMRLETLLGRFSVRRATVTVCPSDAMRRMVEAHVRGRLVTIPFGPGLVESARSGAPPFRFLHLTGWGPHKRLGVLLEAVRSLAETHAGRFVLETVSDPYSPFARKYEVSETERNLLEDSLVAAHVVVRRPTGTQRELVGDAVVIPSPIESFCFPIAEALTVGLPVIATEADYSRELCGEAALYVPQGSAEALRAAMLQLLDGDPPVAGPQRVSSWASHVDSLAALLRDVALG